MGRTTVGILETATTEETGIKMGISIIGETDMVVTTGVRGFAGRAAVAELIGTSLKSRGALSSGPPPQPTESKLGVHVSWCVADTIVAQFQHL